MKIHIVKSGDTLYELSKKYGIPLQKIIDANPQISDPNQLQIGQKVKIPAEPVQVPSADHIIHKHVVKQGDTLWKLSKAWGVSLKEMIDANPQLKNPNALLVGEVVNIPKVKGDPVASENAHANENVNVAHEKLHPGGKHFTGPKEEITAPKAEATAPAHLPPQQLEMPNLPNLPNVLPNITNVMPEVTVPNIMPNVLPEMVKPNETPNVKPEMIKPNENPNIMPEMTIPNVMPNVMPEMIKPNENPNIMPEMTIPNVMPNVMPEMIKQHENPNIMPEMIMPNMMLNVMPEMIKPHENMNIMPEMIMPNVMPNVMGEMHVPNAKPNIMPVAENKPAEIKPIAKEPCGCDDNQWIGGAHHPFMQYTTPVHEVGSYYHMPCDDGVLAEQVSEHKHHHMGKTSHYPGIVEGAEDHYTSNQSWVSPATHVPGDGHWDHHHWENHQSPVAYELSMQSPVSHHPNQPFHHEHIAPIYAPSPCGCSGTAPVYHAPEPAFVDPYCYSHFVLPPWCYPHPMIAPVMEPYGAEPNAQLGAYSHGPNMPFHDPNTSFPGLGGMVEPIWDRAELTTVYPPQQSEIESESESESETESAPSASINSVEVAAQAPRESFETEETVGKAEAEPAKKVKTLSSSRTSRDKAPAKKAKSKNNASRRKNPWIKR
ncbi:LysM peptidoglycan-binding domain-containing protein [Paenibacillus azoreducens]|uniref:LysM domain-containing protein n=1 Tax=Paenibacillus azoreducens TaxID=116718 RepID=A0A920CQ95_9BACL|nr:LysM peptidoglycan-binding domain-containing protein [Paenibacillus azoreducens]GIO49556.1 hypothetical protein J34TS1_43210 [Paenibacillus azoreducens]